MQTFLPYESFVLSAQVLDRQRLGKQRVEALQILNTLTGRSTGWSNHPAVKMWRGHERTLCVYALAVCYEWTKRGYKDTVTQKVFEILDTLDQPFTTPDWLGDDGFHRSHQSNLLRKDPQYYEQFGWAVPDDLPYIWTTTKETTTP